jgi:hypothetical protein
VADLIFAATEPLEALVKALGGKDWQRVTCIWILLWSSGADIVTERADIKGPDGTARICKREKVETWDTQKGVEAIELCLIGSELEAVRCRPLSSES